MGLRKIEFYFLLPFILLLLKSEIGQAQSYDKYHQMITAAEDFYFLENNVDSSLAYYEKCFEIFDFVFARDAVNAFQIAFNEDKPIEGFLKKSFESGVTPSILSSIPALSDFAKNSLPHLSIMRDYNLHRSRYLDRINIECLNETYRLGIIDQINKNNEGRNETDALFKLAVTYGLPGERNSGIEDLGIHKELGNEAVDFISLRDKLSKTSGKNLSYYSLNKNSLIMHLPLVIMLHDYCTFKHFEKSLHRAYLEGFIHPRDIGCIYDNASQKNHPNCRIVPNRGSFGLNVFANASYVDSKKANQLRAAWNIYSIETDIKKEELEKLGFKFIWDYW